MGRLLKEISYYTIVIWMQNFIVECQCRVLSKMSQPLGFLQISWNWWYWPYSPGSRGSKNKFRSPNLLTGQNNVFLDGNLMNFSILTLLVDFQGAYLKNFDDFWEIPQMRWCRARNKNYGVGVIKMALLPKVRVPLLCMNHQNNWHHGQNWAQNFNLNFTDLCLCTFSNGSAACGCST